MKPHDSAIRDVIAGIDTAFDALDADLLQLSIALEAGISLEVIGEVNRILYTEGPWNRS